MNLRVEAVEESLRRFLLSVYGKVGASIQSHLMEQGIIAEDF